MPTIVTYTDDQPPLNHFPQRIISPSRSGPCCFSDMEEISGPQEEGRWVFQYKRCRKCGFAVRVIVRHLPDQTEIANLQKLFATVLSRRIAAV